MTTKNIIRKYLKYKKYRDDDKLLTLAVWSDWGFNLTPDQWETFMALPSMDVIIRRRRELRGEFPESPKVMERRFRHYLGFK